MSNRLLDGSPGSHNLRILELVKDPSKRLQYVRAAIENGWSWNGLARQIESGLSRRRGKATTNFKAALPAVDDLLRHAGGKSSIGLILCKTKNGVIAEYAVRDMAKPLGIAEFRHLEKLPEQLKGTLPSIEEIEAELGEAIRDLARS